MEPIRPAVSRETRLLLAIVLVSLSMLWVLARVRFPGRLATPNPVPPVLAQLAPPSALDDIASSVARLGPRIDVLLTSVDVRRWSRGDAAGPTRAIVPALRVRDDLAVAALDYAAELAETPASAGVSVVARDPVTQLTVFRVPAVAVPLLETWSPARLPEPRFLVAAAVSRNGMSLRPVFVGSLSSTVSPFWPGSIWAAPERTDFHSGSFVFTVDGALAGLAIETGEGPAIVPGSTVIVIVDRMLQEGSRKPGWLGIQAQALTPDIASAIGTSAGVIVTWVAPEGPAAGQVAIADVIERLDGQSIATAEQWEARVAGLAEGDDVVIAVRRRNDLREVHVSAGPPPAPAGDWPLGLALRAISRVGVEVVRVDPGSAAARAGLRPGDLITAVGGVEAPTPAQVTRLFGATPVDRPLLAAVARGEAHHVVVLEKKR
jgi:S1-C subfamily serine protease